MQTLYLRVQILYLSTKNIPTVVYSFGSLMLPFFLTCCQIETGIQTNYYQVKRLNLRHMKATSMEKIQIQSIIVGLMHVVPYL